MAFEAGIGVLRLYTTRDLSTAYFSAEVGVATGVYGTEYVSGQETTAFPAVTLGQAVSILSAQGNFISGDLEPTRIDLSGYREDFEAAGLVVGENEEGWYIDIPFTPLDTSGVGVVIDVSDVSEHNPVYTNWYMYDTSILAIGGVYQGEFVELGRTVVDFYFGGPLIDLTTPDIDFCPPFWQSFFKTVEVDKCPPEPIAAPTTTIDSVWLHGYVNGADRVARFMLTGSFATSGEVLDPNSETAYESLTGDEFAMIDERPLYAAGGVAGRHFSAEGGKEVVSMFKLDGSSITAPAERQVVLESGLSLSGIQDKEQFTSSLLPKAALYVTDGSTDAIIRNHNYLSPEQIGSTTVFPDSNRKLIRMSPAGDVVAYLDLFAGVHRGVSTETGEVIWTISTPSFDPPGTAKVVVVGVGSDAKIGAQSGFTAEWLLIDFATGAYEVVANIGFILPEYYMLGHNPTTGQALVAANEAYYLIEPDFSRRQVSIGSLGTNFPGVQFHDATQTWYLHTYNNTFGFSTIFIADAEFTTVEQFNIESSGAGSGYRSFFGFGGVYE